MKRTLIFAALLTVLILAWAALAQARSADSGIYNLNWYTIDGGGDTSTGSGYTLVGTIGQSDAGAAMNGNGFTLNGGFWISGASQYRVHLPLVIK
jgi:hypothetical protein